MAILTKLYVFSLVLGGILLAASVFSGGDHDGGDVDGGDADLGGDGDGGIDHHEPGHGDAAGFAAMFLSLRFWTFFSAFFGLTGLVFDGLELLPSLPSLGLALVLGFGIASGTATLMRFLGQSDVGEVPGSHDYVGQTARVLLPFGKGDTGKVRLTLKGTLVDVLASTDEEEPFRADERALVVEMQGTTAYVSRIEKDDGREDA